MTNDQAEQKPTDKSRVSFPKTWAEESACFDFAKRWAAGFARSKNILKYEPDEVESAAGLALAIALDKFPKAKTDFHSFLTSIIAKQLFKACNKSQQEEFEETLETLVEDQCDSASVHSGILADMAKQEQLSQVAKIVENLPDELKDIAVLLSEGMTQADVAKQLGLSNRRVKYLVSKLRNHRGLRKVLEE